MIILLGPLSHDGKSQEVMFERKKGVLALTLCGL